MAGSGETTTVVDIDFDVSATDVACTVTVMFAVTEAGAAYVTADVVGFVRVPHAVPLQPVPATAQVTPLALESLLTVAAKFKVWASSMWVWADGVTDTERTGTILLEVPPPQALKTSNPERNRTDFLIIPPSAPLQVARAIEFQNGTEKQRPSLAQRTRRTVGALSSTQLLPRYKCRLASLKVTSCHRPLMARRFLAKHSVPVWIPGKRSPTT
jgi:hypothetical protein